VDRCNTTLHLAAEVPDELELSSGGPLRLVELTPWLRHPAAGPTFPAALVPATGDNGLAREDARLLVASILPRPKSPTPNPSPEDGGGGNRKGAKRRFRLEPASQADARKSEPFRFADVNESSVGLWEGEHPILVYNHGILRREEYSPRFDRSGYVHPLYGLDGEVLTDDFPRDHPHHRGLFWAWAHVRVGEKESSPWHVQGIRSQFVRWLHRDASATAAVLGVENGWYNGDSKVVTERVWLRIYPACGDERAIDVDLTLTAETSPVVIWGAAEKSYGGMTVRFGPRKKTTITTAAGQSMEDLNLAHLAWADLTAQFPGASGRSGAALLLDRSHPHIPPTWITRHYGCLGVGWPGIEPVTLEPGQPVRCRYRVLIHRGQVDAQQLAAAFEAFDRKGQVVWGE
jgi:hypothetical protein